LSKEQVSRWTCPTCNQLTETHFCPVCGEQALRARDLTLRVLIDQVVEAFTSIDSKLIRSFRYLLARPGFLTEAFLKGQRKPYLGPVGLFLICNVFFFATESLTRSEVFTTSLESHLYQQDWKGIAEALVDHRLQAKHKTLANYAPAFNEAVASKARSLIILMALVFTAAPALLFRRSGRPLVANAVFSLHLYAFLLLLLSVGISISWVAGRFGVNLKNGIGDNILSVGLLLASAAYLYFATGIVYRERGLSRGLKVAVLAMFMGVLVVGYRFALLIITLYTT
jgi:hypothetical protein